MISFPKYGFLVKTQECTAATQICYISWCDLHTSIPLGLYPWESIEPKLPHEILWFYITPIAPCIILMCGKNRSRSAHNVCQVESFGPPNFSTAANSEPNIACHSSCLVTLFVGARWMQSLRRPWRKPDDVVKPRHFGVEICSNFSNYQSNSTQVCQTQRLKEKVYYHNNHEHDY